LDRIAGSPATAAALAGALASGRPQARPRSAPRHQQALTRSPVRLLRVGRWRGPRAASTEGLIVVQNWMEGLDARVELMTDSDQANSALPSVVEALIP